MRAHKVTKRPTNETFLTSTVNIINNFPTVRSINHSKVKLAVCFAFKCDKSQTSLLLVSFFDVYLILLRSNSFHRYNIVKHLITFIITLIPNIVNMMVKSDCYYFFLSLVIHFTSPIYLREILVGVVVVGCWLAMAVCSNE